MKTFKGFLILVAIILLVVGGVFIGIGIKNKDYKNVYGNIVDESFESIDEIDDINLKIDTTDVRIVKTDESKVKVVCHEREKLLCKVDIADNTLNIVQEDSRAWYEKIMIFPFGAFENTFITVYLPNDKYQKLCKYSQWQLVVLFIAWAGNKKSF